MSRDPLRLSTVTALPNHRLSVTFEDDWKTDIDLSDWIANTQQLKPLVDPALFGQVRLGDFGTSVVWIDDELDLGADNLRNLAVEQTGGIGHERLITWIHENRLTQVQAADAIGISRRMLNYYLSGTKPIPKTVWLACLGWIYSQHRHAA